MVSFTMGSNKGLVSDWYNKDSLNRLYGLVKEGDLLEFDRTPIYNHWAVCVEVGGRQTKVVHRSAGATKGHCFLGLNKKWTSNVSTMIELLADVLGEDTVRINNSLDKSMDPMPTEVIANNAQHYKANEDEVGEYNVASNNCEHFATLCRYGKKKSQQVDTAIAIATVAAGQYN